MSPPLEGGCFPHAPIPLLEIQACQNPLPLSLGKRGSWLFSVSQGPSLFAAGKAWLPQLGLLHLPLLQCKEKKKVFGRVGMKKESGPTATATEPHAVDPQEPAGVRLPCN